MNEEQLSRLRSKIQSRKERLLGTARHHFLPMLLRFWDFLNSEPFFAPILSELEANNNGKQARLGLIFVTGDKFETVTNSAARKSIANLKTDEEAAAFAWGVINGLKESDFELETVCNIVWGNERGNTDAYSYFKPEVVTALCDYLAERLDEQQAILGLLVRYKKRCEWFNKPALFKIAEDEKAKKAKNEKGRAEVEKALKDDLYRYLHDQGIDFTIEPKSDRGEIDVILDQVGAGRKYIEGKVFDNKERKSDYITKGYGQLLHYLRQYTEAVGYLLIYKTCEEQRVIEGDGQIGTIPFVRCDGRTIFVLVVDICQYGKAVSQRVFVPVRITASDFTKAVSPPRDNV